MACPNGATPLLLPIQNNTVTEDGASSARGIEIAIGNPQQVLSLLPAVADYDLFVFNSADCGPASNDTCIAQKGGVFNPKKSSTYAVSTEAQWNGTKDSQLDDGSYIYFNDVLRFGPEGEYFGFPAFMNQPGHGSQAGLPLGANSTFLQAAFDSGQAPSKVWGLWPGSRNIYDPVDGLLIVGGYDTARVDGEWTTFPTFEGCATCVVVSDVTYEYAGGSTSLFSNSSQVLQIGLEPFTKVINLPQDMYEKFAAASLGTYDPELELLTYDINNPPTGNVSVTLSNGYKTTMLAQELFSKPRTYNADGVYSIRNDSVIISTVTNVTEAGYVASWGMPYLTMNYMLMDHEKQQFKMAPAHRAAYSENGGSLVSTICAAAAAAPATGTSSASASASPAARKHSSNTGAIVGGVVGGILGLGLIIGAIGYFFWRAQRKRRAANQANQSTPGAPPYQQGQPGTMSEAGDTRASIWTSTAATEYSELASPNNGFKEHPTVNGWLQNQGRIPEENEKYHMSATSGPMNEPLEMPAEPHR